MTTLTGQSNTAQILEDALNLVRIMNIPPDTSINVDVHERHDHQFIYLFPQTVEDRRRVLSSPAFAGVCWEDHGIAGSRWVQAQVGGFEVSVFAERRAA